MEKYLEEQYGVIEDERYLKSEEDIEDFIRGLHTKDLFDCGQGYSQDHAFIILKIGEKFYGVDVYADIMSAKQEYGDRLYWVEGIRSVNYIEIDKPIKPKYTLEKSTMRDMFIVTIVADSNDGDYITTEKIYKKETFVEHVVDELINLLDNFSGNHQLSDYSSIKYDLSIPYNGWDGNCHSIKSVNIEYIDDNGDHWNVIVGSKENSEQ